MCALPIDAVVKMSGEILDLILNILTIAKQKNPPFFVRVRELLKPDDDSAQSFDDLLYRGLDQARARNYGGAYKCFSRARDIITIQPENARNASAQVKKRRKSRTSRSSSEENERDPKVKSARIWFLMLWCGVECAFAVRGRPGRQLLEICRKEIERLCPEISRKETEWLCPETSRLPQESKAYLQFLYGLAWSMEVDSSDRELPHHDNLTKEINMYRAVQTELANARLEHDHRPDDDRKKAEWKEDYFNTMDDAVQKRLERVQQLQALHFGRQ